MIHVVFSVMGIHMIGNDLRFIISGFEKFSFPYKDGFDQFLENHVARLKNHLENISFRNGGSHPASQTSSASAAEGGQPREAREEGGKPSEGSEAAHGQAASPGEPGSEPGQLSQRSPGRAHSQAASSQPDSQPPQTAKQGSAVKERAREHFSSKGARSA